MSAMPPYSGYPTLAELADQVVENLLVLHHADLIGIAERRLYEFQHAHMKGYAHQLGAAFGVEWGVAFEAIRAAAAERFLEGVEA